MTNERQAMEKFFKETFKGKPFLSGFLRPGARVCGRARCTCHKGNLHPTRRLHGYYRRGKHYLRSIDKGQAAEAGNAVRRYKALLKELEAHVHRCRRKLFPAFYDPMY